MRAVVAFAVTVVCWSVGPSVLRAQEMPQEPDSFVRLARFEIEPSTPTVARVRASLEIEGGAPLALALVWFDGQQVRDLRVRQATGPLDVGFAADGGRVRRLWLPAAPAGSRSLYVDYEVEVPSDARFRYPLTVPELAADPAGSSMRIEVLLPQGTVYRDDGFPNLVRAGERDGRRLLRGRVVGAPSFVHVVWGRRGDLLTVPALIQIVAGLFVLLPLALFGYRAWRGRTRAGD